MRLEEIRAKARDMGVPSAKMSKTQAIRAIQQAEGNLVCYATERVAHCEEDGCLWLQDCKKTDGKDG